MSKTKKKSIIVIGGAALEIAGYPKDVCRLRDSNKGFVETYVSGVAKNVAEHLVPYGDATHLVSAIGNDKTGEIIEEYCLSQGILLDYSLHVDMQSASIISIYDEEFDLLTAINEMDIIQEMTPAFFEKLLPVLDKADCVVADSNLSSDSLKYLADHVSVPLYYEPVSVGKAKNIGDRIGKCYAVKANRFEAALLTGCSCDTIRGVYRAAQWLLDKGVKKVLITLGSEGIVYADDTSFGQVEGEEVDVTDSRGAGDCVSAAVIHAMLEGKSLEECAAIGNHAGAVYCTQKHGAL